ncbi:MAG: exonuclease domain-containing protein [Thermostichus sp. BF3_bins_97]
MQHYRRLCDQTLTVVDVETTGSCTPGQRVIEISLLKASLEQGILDHRAWLLNPDIPIPPAIVRLTGITPEMVAQGSDPAVLWPDLQAALQTGVLTAHNLAFDYGFLQLEYERLGIRFVRPKTEQFCTVQLARLMLPDLPSRSLPALVEHFQFPLEGPLVAGGKRSHRAAADTLACWLLAERLLQQVCGEPEEQVLARFGRQWIPVSQAAQILGCSTRQARAQMETAGLMARTGRSGAYLYRRDEVEALAERNPATEAMK